MRIKIRNTLINVFAYAKCLSDIDEAVFLKNLKISLPYNQDKIMRKFNLIDVSGGIIIRCKCSMASQQL